MVKNRELIVIDPSVRCPEIESFNLIARMHCLKLSYHLPALAGMDTLDVLDAEASPAGVIILGSMASVNDKSPWQVGLERWLETHISPGIPMLGICYGHQLLAAMHGSTVKDRGFEAVGFRKVLISEDKRLGVKSHSPSIFVSHREIVEGTPSNFETFASSEEVSVEALRHKSMPLWSFQAHVDATPLFCKGCGYTDLRENMLDEGQSLLRQFLSILS